MKKSTIIGIVFTIVIGSLLHFTYDLSGNNPMIALFSAINESTWEHLKLLFFPYLLYSIYEYNKIGKKYSNYITSKFLGVSIGLICIPVFFYGYTALLQTNYTVIDISIFILSVVISYLVSIYVLNNPTISFNKISLLLIICILLSFIIFTFNAPHAKLFLDPNTKKYGI